VCERCVNLLVCSLPLHRHSYIGFILSFASSIHNKHQCAHTSGDPSSNMTIPLPSFDFVDNPGDILSSVYSSDRGPFDECDELKDPSSGVESSGK
jgi:hypothetical protein